MSKHCSNFSARMHPLRVNRRTNEAYLQLPAPHDNIIITAPRMTDADSLVEIMNDPRVYKMLLDHPYPFLPMHAEAWLSSEKQSCEAVLDEYMEIVERNGGAKERNGQTSSIEYLDGCPVSILREIREDGSDAFIGHIGISRCDRFEFLRDEKQEEAFALRNEEFPAGSPKIIWEIGDFLSPSHHGRGIMTTAMRTIIHDWAVPHMNTRSIYGSAYSGNAGSIKVFLKNGFEEFDFVKNCVKIRKSKGGGKAGVHFLVWHRSE